MSRDDLDERLRAVERALTDGDAAVGDLAEPAAVHDRLDSLETALDATVQSLHGYVGDLEAVNERVQRRADAAREAVERLEDEHRRTARAASASERASDAATGDAGTPADATTSVASRDPAAPDAECGETDGDDASLFDRVRESL